MGGEKPKCVAILLCDMVVEDKRTNNKSFIGCFNRIGAQALPAFHDRMCVVVQLTNIRGQVEIMVKVRNADGTEIMSMGGPVRGSDPFHVLDLILELRKFPLTAAGTHSVEVMFGNELIALRQFEIVVG